MPGGPATLPLFCSFKWKIRCPTINAWLSLNLLHVAITLPLTAQRNPSPTVSLTSPFSPLSRSGTFCRYQWKAAKYFVTPANFYSARTCRLRKESHTVGFGASTGNTDKGDSFYLCWLWFLKQNDSSCRAAVSALILIQTSCQAGRTVSSISHRKLFSYMFLLIYVFVFEWCPCHAAITPSSCSRLYVESCILGAENNTEQLLWPCGQADGEYSCKPHHECCLIRTPRW